MVHRIGIAINDEDLQQVKSLQRRMGIRSRSLFFREIARRYEKMEKELTSLSECRAGYMQLPENTSSKRALLKASLKGQRAEKWGG